MDEPRPVAAVFAACVALGAALAGAQDETSSPEGKLRLGQRLRIEVGTSREVGRLEALRNGRLFLDTPEFALRHPGGLEARSVWVRGRGTMKGAKVGAVLGGVAGGILVGCVVTVLCEVESCSGSWLGGAAVGLVGGGVAGGLTGALIGAASPRWHRVDVAPGQTIPVAPAVSGGQPMGSASLNLGLARGTDRVAPGGGAGQSLSFAADLGRVRPALETGRFQLGGRDTELAQLEPIHYEESLRYVGPSVSVGPARGTVRPYAVASLGLYRWKAGADALVVDPTLEQTDVALHDGNRYSYEHDFVGGSLGGGVRVHGAGTLSFGMEARWHTNLSEGPSVGSEERRRLSVLSLTGGASLGW